MTVYRLPFNFDTEWQLWNGNWDDPIHGHANNATGRNIRAARHGIVIMVRNDLTENTWGWTESQVEQYLRAHPRLTRQALGCGSHVFIRHPEDNTVAAYCHLKAGQTFVTHQNQPIEQGAVIGLADNTGNSSGPHVHFEVRLYWNSYTDLGPTLAVNFEDKNHQCWRPRVGDVLASTNA
jgi:murein DD-endopeptidase MepM/ murein hydrolase activator NlpD